MRPPTDKQMLQLMKKHGDPVDHSNRFGWVYQFSIEGLRELILEWIQREERRLGKLQTDLLNAEKTDGKTTQKPRRSKVAEK